MHPTFMRGNLIVSEIDVQVARGFELNPDNHACMAVVDSHVSTWQRLDAARKANVVHVYCYSQNMAVASIRPEAAASTSTIHNCACLCPAAAASPRLF